MTACVNRKHTKKVAAVVTASLVGALSLGAAPVAAVADTGIETLAADWSTGATITKAHDGNSGAVSNPNQATFAEGSEKYLVPTEVTNSFGDVTEIDSTYTISYYQYDGVNYNKVAGTAATDTDPTTVFNGTQSGTYYVRVEKGSSHTDYIAFKYVGKEALETIAASTLVYNGSNLSGDIEFTTADGDVIKPDAGTTVSYTDAEGNPATLQNAGDYVAKLVYGGATYNVKVTVSKLDLSTASIYCPDIVSGPGFILENKVLSSLEINGDNTLAAANTFKVTAVTAPDGSAGWGTTIKTGQYTLKIADNTSNSNIKGTGTVTFSYLNKSLFSDGYAVNYGRNAIGTSAATATKIYLTDGEAFDATKISVTNGDTSYTGDQLEITYLDGSDEVDASALTKPGTYELKVRVKPFQTFAEDAWYGGTSTVYIEIVGAKIDTDQNLAFYVDGELAGNSASRDFDGHDWLEDITAVVKDSEGNTYEEGTDFTLEVKKGTEEVDSIVNEGSYTIKVKPITFDFTTGTTDTLNFTVNRITVSRLIADVNETKYDADETSNWIPDSVPVYDEDGNPVMDPTTGAQLQDDNLFYVTYTGGTITLPGVKYQVNTGTTAKPKYTYIALSSDLYNVVSIENEDGDKVDEVVEPGTYEVKITLNDAAGSNFTLASGADTFTFTVKKFGHFTDVDSTKWYSVPVEKAYELGYVNGISGTNLFAPEADITRADAVCILFNMAGGFNLPDDDFSFDVEHGYNTGFSDVDGHDYFAKALAWARAFGVANGYGDGTFKPYAQITREEFASMLANYAKAMGKFEAADEGALDSMSDANTVSDWAEANVAWAVENGVMGNGGFVAGQSNITRAEVAAMAANYQPEAL